MPKPWNPAGAALAVVDEDPSMEDPGDGAPPEQSASEEDEGVAAYAALLESLRSLSGDDTIVQAVSLEDYKSAKQETNK